MKCAFVLGGGARGVGKARQRSLKRTDLEVVEARLEPLAEEHAEEAAVDRLKERTSVNQSIGPAFSLAYPPLQTPCISKERKKPRIHALVLGGGHEAVYLVLESRVHEGRPRVRALAEGAGRPCVCLSGKFGVKGCSRSAPLSCRTFSMRAAAPYHQNTRRRRQQQ